MSFVINGLTINGLVPTYACDNGYIYDDDIYGPTTTSQVFLSNFLDEVLQYDVHEKFQHHFTVNIDYCITKACITTIITL